MKTGTSPTEKYTGIVRGLVPLQLEIPYGFIKADMIDSLELAKITGGMAPPNSLYQFGNFNIRGDYGFWMTDGSQTIFEAQVDGSGFIGAGHEIAWSGGVLSVQAAHVTGELTAATIKASHIETDYLRANIEIATGKLWAGTAYEHGEFAADGLKFFGTDGVQTVWIKSDGTGWFGADDAFYWDAAGNVVIAGSLIAGEITAASIKADNILAGNLTAGVSITTGQFTAANGRVTIDANGVSFNNTGIAITDLSFYYNGGLVGNVYAAYGGDLEIVSTGLTTIRASGEDGDELPYNATLVTITLPDSATSEVYLKVENGYPTGDLYRLGLTKTGTGTAVAYVQEADFKVYSDNVGTTKITLYNATGNADFAGSVKAGAIQSYGVSEGTIYLGTSAAAFGLWAGSSTDLKAMFYSNSSWKTVLHLSSSSFPLFLMNHTYDLYLGNKIKTYSDAEIGGTVIAPAAKLTTGAGIHRWLTSDASGNGSWKALAEDGKPAVSVGTLAGVLPIYTNAGLVAYLPIYVSYASYSLFASGYFGNLMGSGYFGEQG